MQIQWKDNWISPKYQDEKNREISLENIHLSVYLLKDKEWKVRFLRYGEVGGLKRIFHTRAEAENAAIKLGIKKLTESAITIANDLASLKES